MNRIENETNPLRLWLLHVVSLFTIGVGVLAVSRWLFFIPGAPEVLFANYVVIGVATLLILFSPFLPDNAPSWKALLKKAWPLFLFIGVLLLYSLVACIRERYIPVHRTNSLSWWATYMGRTLALLAAFVIGIYNRDLSEKTIGRFVLFLITVFLVAGLGEFLQYYGHPNPIGSFVLWLNNTANHPFTAWVWSGKEAIRINSLTVNPQHLGFLSLMFAAWALSAQGQKGLRVAIVIAAFILVYLSGSRTALGLFGIMSLFFVISYLVRNRSIQRNATRGNKRFVRFVVVIAVLLLVGGALYLFIHVLPTRLSNLVSTNQSVGFSFSSLDALLSGRLSLWKEALGAIREHPLGTGFLFRQLFGTTQAHNEILTLWVLGGPFLVVPLVLFAIWVFRVPMQESHKQYGIYFGIAAFGTGLTDSPLSHWQVLILPFFFLGLYLAASWIPSRREERSRMLLRTGEGLAKNAPSTDK